jgi:hypothetical protein
MNAPRQIKRRVGLPISRVKKYQKRFSPGTRVTFKLWQGSVVDWFGTVIADGRPFVWVQCGDHAAVHVRREALTVVKEGGK